MSRISRQYAVDMAKPRQQNADLTNRRAARKLCAMNFRAVRISLIITIIPRMVG